MPLQITVPDDMLAQVAFAFRAKANEYHGAIIRHPSNDAVPAWKRQAEWFDRQADQIRDAGAKEIA